MCGGIAMFMEQHIERILQKKDVTECVWQAVSEEMKVSCYVLIDWFYSWQYKNKLPQQCIDWWTYNEMRGISKKGDIPVLSNKLYLITELQLQNSRVLYKVTEMMPLEHLQE